MVLLLLECAVRVMVRRGASPPPVASLRRHYTRTAPTSGESRGNGRMLHDAARCCTPAATHAHPATGPGQMPGADPRPAVHPCDKRFVSVISSIASALGLAPRPAQLPSAAAASATPWLERPQAPDGRDLAHVRVLSVNDFHGQLGDSKAVVDGTPIGGAATLSAYVQRERAGNPNGTVFVSAGDAIGAAPPVSTLLRHHSTMAVLGAMGLDIATFGNHEFDYGYAEAIRLIFGDEAYAAARDRQGLPPLKRRRRGANAVVGAQQGAKQVAAARDKPRWPGSPFPWVSANVVYEKTGKPVLPPYVIKEVDGVKVAFIGAVTGDLKNVTLARGIPNIKALDPITAINSYVPEIQAKGVKSIVVFIHEGGDTDKQDPTKLSGAIVELAEKLHPEVDAIVSGHSHKEYATTINGKQVVQAGNYVKALGVVELGIDRATGDVVTSSSRLVRNDENGIRPDPVVAGMVKRFEAAVAPKTQRVVTTLTAPLTRVASPSGETTLGSLIADAQRAFARTDIGLMNNGGVRQDVDKTGKVTWGELFGVQPFANIVTRMELTGAEVLEVLEQQFPETGVPRTLQVSGMTVEMDMTRPYGQRIVKVTMADGKPLDPKKTYTVAANSFIADGGDGFKTLKKGRRRQEVGEDLQALVKFLEQGGKVPTGYQDRIKLLAGELPHANH
jgi:2',3'-cyclic-nucleotide 2'-phosphodiesterase (5'-nucleotidase family)